MTDYYVPIEVNEFVGRNNKCKFNYAIESLTQKGFPFHLEYSDLFYFKLPSQGCHRAVHFLWKQPKNEKRTTQQLQLIDQLRSCKKTFYLRPMRREIQSKLKYLGMVKAHHVVYVIKYLGDDFAASSQNEFAVLDKSNIVIETGEDIIVNIQRNNGKNP